MGKRDDGGVRHGLLGRLGESHGLSPWKKKKKKRLEAMKDLIRFPVRSACLCLTLSAAVFLPNSIPVPQYLL